MGGRWEKTGDGEGEGGEDRGEALKTGDARWTPRHAMGSTFLPKRLDVHSVKKNGDVSTAAALLRTEDWC